MPNVFTPDGNGENETFSFPYDIFASFNITIMNRWGNVIHIAQNKTGTEFWNGRTDSGDPVNEGTYFYIFDGTLKDGTYLKKDGFVDVYKKN
jgi:gliding motility-associated-like protein